MSLPRPIIDEVTPDQAHSLLSEAEPSVLVDVRTRAEWSFVGVPDISETGKPLLLVEWVSFPSGTPNPDFLNEVLSSVDAADPKRIFFICRSGQRSMSAAHAVAQALAEKGKIAHCTNVAEGFEGDLCPDGHRGVAGGWKARGLPWKQS